MKNIETFDFDTMRDEILSTEIDNLMAEVMDTALCEKEVWDYGDV